MYGGYPTVANGKTLTSASRAAVIAAVTGKTLGLRRVSFLADAAMSVTITDEDGTALSPALPTFYLEANVPATFTFEPGDHWCTAVTKGISVTPSAGDALGVEMEAIFQ